MPPLGWLWALSRLNAARRSHAVPFCPHQSFPWSSSQLPGADLVVDLGHGWQAGYNRRLPQYAFLASPKWPWVRCMCAWPRSQRDRRQTHRVCHLHPQSYGYKWLQVKCTQRGSRPWSQRDQRRPPGQADSLPSLTAARGLRQLDLEHLVLRVQPYGLKGGLTGVQQRKVLRWKPFVSVSFPISIRPPARPPQHATTGQGCGVRVGGV